MQRNKEEVIDLTADEPEQKKRKVVVVKKLFRCLECQKFFKKEDDLNEHTESSHPKPLPSKPFFACNHCGEKFTEAKELKNHVKKGHEKDTSYTCTHCMKKLASYFLLENHMKIHHNDGDESKESEMVFIPEADPIHLQEQSSQSEGCNKCDVCKKRFRKKTCLKQHYEDIHRNIYPYACFKEKRSYMFKTKSQYDHHMRTMHQSILWFEQESLCSICGKKLTSPPELRAHMNIHTGNEDFFDCDTCSNSFKTHDELNEHIGYEHPEKDTEYTCHMCQFTSRSAGYFNLHNKIHNSNQNKCKVCGKEFFFTFEYDEHIKKCSITEGIRNCEYCPSKFTDDTLLKVHIARKHSHQKHQCKYCPNIFVSLQILKNHMARAHPYAAKADL